MKFDSKAYSKLFPRVEEVKPVESVVETFKPTEEIEQRATEISQPAESVEDVREEVNTDGSGSAC